MVSAAAPFDGARPDEADADGVPKLRSCGCHLPGHEVHWIQRSHAAVDAAHPCVEGRLVSVEPDGLVVIEVGGERLRLWHHQPDRLRALVAGGDLRVEYQRRWHLLHVPVCDGRVALCVADADDPALRPCPSERADARSRTRARRLIETGGFSVRARDLPAEIAPEEPRGRTVAEATLRTHWRAASQRGGAGRASRCTTRPTPWEKMATHVRVVPAPDDRPPDGEVREDHR